MNHASPLPAVKFCARFMLYGDYFHDVTKFELCTLATCYSDHLSRICPNAAVNPWLCKQGDKAT